MRSMDRPTLEALQRIMELIQPRSGAPAELRDDWHRVASWMQDAARDIETLATHDPRRGLTSDPATSHEEITREEAADRYA
jgi:hypothetical protein